MEAQDEWAAACRLDQGNGFGCGRRNVIAGFGEEKGLGFGLESQSGRIHVWTGVEQHARLDPERVKG